MNDGIWSIPRTWEWCAFDDVALIAQNLVAPEQVRDLPHIAPNHIEGRTGRLLDFRTVAEDEVISPKQRFFPGQIVFSKIRPYLRKSALVDFDGVCSADMYPIWPSEAIDRGYLLSWLLSEDFRDEAMEHQGRTLLPKINQTGLKRTRLPLPPLPEQRRIVAKLDHLSARSRAAREHLARTTTLAARAKQAILAAAFRGDLTAEWREAHEFGSAESAKLNDLCRSLTDGDHQAPPKAEKGIPFITISAINTGKLCLEKATRFVPASYRDALKETRRAERGDILFSVTGSLGIAALVDTDTPFVFQRHIAILKPDETRVRIEFLFHMLGSPEVRRRAFEEATGVAQLTLSLSKLRAFDIPCPNLEEQDEIVRRIESAFARIDRLTEEAGRAAHLLDRLDERLLARAFRGELVPQDPTDEPATALLARIHAARAAAPTPRRTRKRKPSDAV